MVSRQSSNRYFKNWGDSKSSLLKSSLSHTMRFIEYHFSELLSEALWGIQRYEGFRLRFGRKIWAGIPKGKKEKLVKLLLFQRKKCAWLEKLDGCGSQLGGTLTFFIQSECCQLQCS